MKKQIATLAILMVASNLAFAKGGPSASSVNMSSEGIDKLLSGSNSVSKVSINIVGGAEDGIESVRKAIETEGQAKTKKGGIAQKGLGASSAMAAFSVESVELIAQGAEIVTRTVLNGLYSGSKLVVDVTEENVAVPVANFTDRTGKAVVQGATSAASAVLQAGRNVVVGTTSSGLVMIQESAKSGVQGATAVAEGVQGNGNASSNAVGNSSNLLIGSFGKASEAMGSELVKGFTKKK